MGTLDPFTQVSKAILYSLKAWSGWLTVVGTGKVEDMTLQTFETFLRSTVTGDMPGVILLQGAFKLSTGAPNSRAAGMTQVFKLATCHDTLRVADTLNPLKWQTMIALVKAGDQFNAGFLAGFNAGILPDQRPMGFGISSWEIIDGADRMGFDKQDEEGLWTRGSLRWYSALAIRVEMYADKQALFQM